MNKGVILYRGSVLAFPKYLKALFILDHLKSKSWGSLDCPVYMKLGYKDAQDNLIRSYPKDVVL